MKRLTSYSLGATFAVLATAAPALAQQAELASKLNDEGKALMYEKKFAEASAKFQQAVARVAEPKYFFNLCLSLRQEGKLGEALTACQAVTKNGGTGEVADKANKLIEKIDQDAKAHGIDHVEPVGGGGGPDQDVCATNPADPSCTPPPKPDICATNPSDPSCTVATPPPRPQTQPTVVAPPSSEGVFTSMSPDNKYTWSLGIDLYGGGGQLGETDFYGTTAGGLRVKGDYLINPASRLGAQAYFQLTHFGKGDMDAVDVDTLDVFDLGIAGYKHFCLANTQRLCITPLGGVQLALMSPAGESDGAGSQVFNYAAVGGRVEVMLQYAFGRRFEHVLGFGAGANFYSSVFLEPSETEGESKEFWGLDKGGGFGYITAGYTYRFNTPLGSSPFVTLE